MNVFVAGGSGTRSCARCAAGYQVTDSTRSVNKRRTRAARRSRWRALDRDALRTWLRRPSDHVTPADRALKQGARRAVDLVATNRLRIGAI